MKRRRISRRELKMKKQPKRAEEGERKNAEGSTKNISKEESQHAW
jgi:hypothetical protein